MIVVLWFTKNPYSWKHIFSDHTLGAGFGSQNQAFQISLRMRSSSNYQSKTFMMFIFDFGFLEIFEPEIILSDLLPTFAEQGFLVTLDPLAVFLSDNYQIQHCSSVDSLFGCRFQTLSSSINFSIVAFLLRNFIWSLIGFPSSALISWFLV